MPKEKDLLEELTDFMVNSGKTLTETFEKISKDVHDTIYEICPQCHNEFSVYLKNQTKTTFCPACGFNLTETKNEYPPIGFAKELTIDNLEQVRELDRESGLNITPKFSYFALSPHLSAKKLYGVFTAKTKKLVGYCLIDHASGEFFKDCEKWSNNEIMIDLLYVRPCSHKDKNEYREILLNHIQNTINVPIFAALTKPEDVQFFKKNGFKQIDTVTRFNNTFTITHYDK